MEDEFISTELNYREELLRLAAEKIIKHREKYIQKASDEVLKRIYDEYQERELDGVNEQITSILITNL